MPNQKTIISNKLWDASLKLESAIFPTEFYAQKEILTVLDSFDLHHVSFSFTQGKTDKGFDAFVITFFKKNKEGNKHE